MDIKDIEIDPKGLNSVSSNPNDLEKGNPIVFQKNDQRIVGKVADVFVENDVTKILFELRDGSKEIAKANDPHLQPLFMKNKETGKKTYLRYSYSEVKNLLDQNKFNGAKYDDIGKTGMINLMLGGKTKVVDDLQLKSKETSHKVAENYNVSGRFSLYESKGKISVNLETKNRELNLDHKVFGLELTSEQKEKLKNTNELGLVNGFVNTKTGEITSKWVSIDSQLNKVVTRPEKSMYIDKIFGRDLTTDEKNTLKKGEGALMEFKKNNGETYKMFVQASAASTKLNGLKIYNEDKARELKLIPSEDKKKSKSKGIKI